MKPKSPADFEPFYAGSLWLSILTATNRSQDDLACSSSRPRYLASAPAPSPAAAEDEASSFAPAVRPTMDRKRPALLRPAVGLMTPFLSSSDPSEFTFNRWLFS